MFEEALSTDDEDDDAEQVIARQVRFPGRRRMSSAGMDTMNQKMERLERARRLLESYSARC